MANNYTLTLEKERVLKVEEFEVARLMRHSRLRRVGLVESLTGPYQEMWDLSGHDNREGIQWLMRKLGWRWQHVSPAILGYSPAVEAVVLSSPPSVPGKNDQWDVALIYEGDSGSMRVRCPLLDLDFVCEQNLSGVRVLMDERRLWWYAHCEGFTATFEMGTFLVR